MRSITKLALALADQGIPVFPCRSTPDCKRTDKNPICKGGLNAASIDPVVVEEYFERVGADLIGVPTGEASGWDAIDIDPRHGGEQWESEHAGALVGLRCHTTRSGGRHYLVQANQIVRNSQGKLGQGVDVRAGGGYIVWWPAAGLPVANPKADLPWPSAMLVAATAKPPRTAVDDDLAAVRRVPSPHGAQVVLDRLVETLRTTAEGNRHAAMLSATTRLAPLILAGLLDEDTAVQRTSDAIAEAGAEDMENVARIWESALVKAEPSADKSTGGAEFEALPDEAEPMEDWRDMLQRGKPKKDGEPGGILLNQLNAEIMFRYAPFWAGRLRYNAFRNQMEIDGRAVKDADWLHAVSWAQNEYLQFNKAVVLDGMTSVAGKNQYHPVRDMLAALPAWDGVSRTDTWLMQYAGAVDTPLHRAYCRKWLIALVARVMQPGCKADEMIILEGDQGLRKSTVYETLCGNEAWFLGHIGDVRSKDTLQNFRGKWIAESGELDSMLRAEASALKSFMSARIDTFRASYGRFSEDYPRQCLFGGSVNPGASGYLKDETGARRYWPIACGVGWPPERKIDTDGLKAIRDQLLAEALHRYQAGEPWHLDTHGLETEQRAATDERYEVDPWEAPIEDFLSDKHSITVQSILKEGLGIPVKDQDKRMANRAGAVLRRLGWTNSAVRLDGKLVRRWRSGKPASESSDQKVVAIGDMLIG